MESVITTNSLTDGCTAFRFFLVVFRDVRNGFHKFSPVVVPNDSRSHFGIAAGTAALMAKKPVQVDHI